MTPDQLQTFSLAARVIERMTLSLIVILVALVLIVAFWKSLQKIDFTMSKDNNQLATSVVFATPIFILLIIVAFSYVTFSHPLVLVQNSTKGNVVNNSVQEPKRNKQSKSDKSNDKFSFFAGMTHDEVSEIIDTLNQSRNKLKAYRSGQNKSIHEIASAYSLLDVTIDDLIRNSYGREVVTDCLNVDKNKPVDETCKKIREWRQ